MVYEPIYEMQNGVGVLVAIRRNDGATIPLDHRNANYLEYLQTQEEAP